MATSTSISPANGASSDTTANGETFMTANNSQSDDANATDTYRHGTGKSATIHEQLEQIAVSPVGWTFIDPAGDGALDALDRLGGDE